MLHSITFSVKTLVYKQITVPIYQKNFTIVMKTIVLSSLIVIKKWYPHFDQSSPLF